MNESTRILTFFILGPSDTSIARGLVRSVYNDDFSAEIHQGYVQVQDHSEPFLTGEYS